LAPRAAGIAPALEVAEVAAAEVEACDDGLALEAAFETAAAGVVDVDEVDMEDEGAEEEEGAAVEVPLDEMDRGAAEPVRPREA